MGKASVKVDGGKLVKVKTEFSDVLEDVEIRGDFFIQPPEALEELEQKLEGMAADSTREELVGKLQEVEAKLIGFSADEIAEAVKKSVQGDEE